MIDLDDDIRQQIIIREFAKAQSQMFEFMNCAQHNCNEIDDCKTQDTLQCPYIEEADT